MVQDANMPGQWVLIVHKLRLEVERAFEIM
jgi:hypothetical protein